MWEKCYSWGGQFWNPAILSGAQRCDECGCLKGINVSVSHGGLQGDLEETFAGAAESQSRHTFKRVAPTLCYISLENKVSIQFPTACLQLMLQFHVKPLLEYHWVITLISVTYDFRRLWLFWQGTWKDLLHHLVMCETDGFFPPVMLRLETKRRTPREVPVVEQHIHPSPSVNVKGLKKKGEMKPLHNQIHGFQCCTE